MKSRTVTKKITTTTSKITLEAKGFLHIIQGYDEDNQFSRLVFKDKNVITDVVEIEQGDYIEIKVIRVVKP